MARAFTIANDLACQRRRGLRYEIFEFVRIGFDARSAGCEQEHRIVSGHASVHIDSVERHFHSSIQRRLQLAGAHHGIRGDDA